MLMGAMDSCFHENVERFCPLPSIQKICFRFMSESPADLIFSIKKPRFNRLFRP